MSVQKHNVEYPLLPLSSLPAGQVLKNLKVPLHAVESNREMLDLAVSQVERFGWKFLFEIPGSLFDQPTAGAAALATVDDSTKPRLIVLITDLSSGMIQVVEEGGMSEQSLSFVDSYAGVLELMADASCTHNTVS